MQRSALRAAADAERWADRTLRRNMKRLLVIAMMLTCLLAGCAAGSGSPAPANQAPWDGAVQAYGALRAMFHEGQTGPAISLDALLPDPELYAVGALASLSGEVTVLGGRAFLSYPSGDGARTEAPAQTSAAATLLVISRVPSWRSVTTHAPIRFEQLDDEIASLAVSAGMSLDERFPFLVEGEFEDLQWHVIDGSRLTAGGTSHQDHLEAAVKMRRDQVPATLVGFYSENDQGVFTHMGSRTHIHCVVDEPVVTGHVDHVVISAGAIVRFPVRPNLSSYPLPGSTVNSGTIAFNPLDPNLGVYKVHWSSSIGELGVAGCRADRPSAAEPGFLISDATRVPERKQSFSVVVNLREAELGKN
jgi:acetolactate decarboxylase